jgi:Zn-finger nucleic acid-binding protein
MLCRGCDAPIEEQGVFPGGTVRCAGCGTDNVVLVAHAPDGGAPYRQPEPPVAQPSRPHAGTGAGLGPLCPRCPRSLVDDTEREGLCCAACGGVLLSHAMLATMVESARPTGESTGRARHAARIPKESEVHYAPCPECRQVMARMDFGRRSGIVVDVCRSHGTWFDGRELEAALDFVRAGGLEEDIDEALRQRAPAPSPQGTRLERQLEVALRSETEREVAAAEDLLWATGSFVRCLFANTPLGYRAGRRRRRG